MMDSEAYPFIWFDGSILKTLSASLSSFIHDYIWRISRSNYNQKLQVINSDLGITHPSIGSVYFIAMDHLFVQAAH
jgi:hypothetical protein